MPEAAAEPRLGRSETELADSDQSGAKEAGLLPAPSAGVEGAPPQGPVGEPQADQARRSRWGVVAAAALVTACIGSGSVLIDALSAPGSDSVAAKLAEWGRDHGLGTEVTWLEALSYEHSRPPVGGSPPGGIPTPTGAIPDPPSARSPVPLVGPSAPPIAPQARGKALPGEGQWHTVVESRGHPAVQVASLRPDDQHTSFVAGVMRIDPALVRGQLHPGTRDPGGSWRTSTQLSRADLTDIAAVFNGGFRLSDPSHNGYYSEGRTVAPLVTGKASLVLYRDGHADVGAWGNEVRMTPDVASVRQNLLPLVDHGKLNLTCATGGPKEWGSTVGQAAFIHRSGFGITADGSEVYVGGPSLSVCTLGRILLAAGVVRAMELDINPNWVSGAYFHDHPGGMPSGFRLFPGEQVSADHYLVASSRDWYSWSLRSSAGVGAPTSWKARTPRATSGAGAPPSERRPVSSSESRRGAHS